MEYALMKINEVNMPLKIILFANLLTSLYVNPIFSVVYN